jgi:hypothetical protein
MVIAINICLVAILQFSVAITVCYGEIKPEKYFIHFAIQMKKIVSRFPEALKACKRNFYATGLLGVSVVQTQKKERCNYYPFHDICFIGSNIYFLWVFLLL